MSFISKIKKVRFYIFLFLLPALIIYTAFMIFPLFNSMRMSFYTGSGIVPDQFCGFQNYVKLFTQFPFRDRLFSAFFNNIKFFLMVSVFPNVAGFFLAILLPELLVFLKHARYKTFCMSGPVKLIRIGNK